MLLQEETRSLAVACSQAEAKLGLEGVGGFREGKATELMEDLLLSGLNEVLGLDTALTIC